MSQLVIPIDASQISDQDRKQQKVKVAIKTAAGITSQVVAVDQGRAEVKLDVDPKQNVSIAVGPENASDEDMFHLQTLTSSVSPSQWGDKKALTLEPLKLTLQWWRLWLIWCREFVISGRLLCADGSPVPGAEVRAYDVDFFWWWSSAIEVGGPAITDPSGHFTIKFRWCCGWYPWWWWVLRHWRLEPLLVEKIYPVLKLNPNLRFREPSPVPTLDMISLTQPAPAPNRPTVTAGPVLASLQPAAKLSPALAVSSKLVPTALPALREKLTATLPPVPELERLRIWPWWPWTPWLDCTPDIIFRVTQNCGGQVKTIVNENIFQTRWDIPTHLNVTLVANDEACCLPQEPPPPDGDCALITGVCGDPGTPVTDIGGNSGAPATPVGYADPGTRDRPFSEYVYISGQFGTAAQADYYEIQYTPHGANAWAPVPPTGMLDMLRGYFDATQPWPNQWFYIPFPVKSLNGKNVYESRQHYEATNPPNNWGNPMSGRTWFYNVNQIASIQTSGVFPDGVYDFRIFGYKAQGAGLDVNSGKVLDGCGNHPENNLLILAIDNRIVLPQTPGTVHVNTTEPDCGILAVRLGGVGIEPCGAQQLQHGTPFEIDFFATDNASGSETNGHLDHYELWLKYDLGSVKNLLSIADVGSFTLTSLSGGQQGPDYSNALTQGAARPIWHGGTMRLHIDDASKVFPKTCCYLIELTVWKRNIVNCDGHLTYYNQMHDSFTITV